MKKPFSLFTFIIAFTVLMFTGCSEQQSEGYPLNNAEIENDLGIVAGAAMYRGTITEISHWIPAAPAYYHEVVFTIEQYSGTNFGYPLLQFVVDENTRANVSPEDLEIGMFVEIFYSAPLGDGIQQPVIAIQVRELLDANLVYINGEIVEVVSSSDQEGMIVLRRIGSGDEVVILYNQYTQFYLDFESIKEGYRINVFTNGISTRSIPPQMTALEIRPYVEEHMDIPTQVPATVSNPVFLVDRDFAVNEFGEIHKILVNQGPLGVYIRYPQNGGQADAAIAEWAYSTYESVVADFEEILAQGSDARGELNIQFDSFLVHERYAGVIKRGFFTHTHLAHPIDILETFNLDTAEDRLLDNEEILDFEQTDRILALLGESITEVAPDAGQFLYAMDPSWLSKIALSHDGLVVILVRGEFLPSYIGTIEILLPYEELGSAFLMWDAIRAPVPITPLPAPVPIAPYAITPTQASEIDSSRPMVAITFDDGPSGYTSGILDLLEQNGSRATFFMLGNLVDSRRDTVARAAALGNDVVGHTWDHRDLSKLTEQDIIAEISDTSALIISITGVHRPIYRPPYGAYNDTVKRVSAELGYSIIMWSVDTLDWKYRDSDWVYNAVINEVSDGAIILLHDIHGTTAEAMYRVIPRLVAYGYQLVTVSELLYHRYGGLEFGRVYYRAG